MTAVAMTDQNNLFAAVKFYSAALKYGIKPIIGCDLLLANPAEGEAPHRVTLLCKNNTGYQHLMCLVSELWLDDQQQQGQSVLALKKLSEHTEGLIVLLGTSSDVAQALIADKIEDAQTLLKAWQRLFAGNLYSAVQRTGRVQDNLYLKHMLPIASQQHIPMVAVNDVRFLDTDDFSAHETRLCIQQSCTLHDKKRLREYSQEQYLRNSDEMDLLFQDHPEFLQNTIEITKRCNVYLDLKAIHLPRFPVPKGDTAEHYLKKSSRDGLEKHFTGELDEAMRQVYEERLAYELGVIQNMGFAGYFLIVADFIRWAKEHGVPVGPGRGSGSGSLVAYVLGITDIDPMHYDLLFERFLNPERVSMPDFDIDFCMEGRDSVIEYVMDKYGRDQVAQIITFGTMAAKAVVRDVGRALAYPYGFVDTIAKLIPFQVGITLDEAIAQEKELAKRYEREADVKKLLNLAKKLEGLVRNAGKHAGGIVIAPTALSDFTALYCEAGNQQVVTQFDKDDVERIGLVKFDFLGLRTLTIIDWTVQTINRMRGDNESLDITQLPLDDDATFAMLRTSQTTAVFQLESRGIRDLIKRLQPNCFADIMALVALYRPGPLQSGMTDNFIERRQGEGAVTYWHASLTTILEPTYGLIVYQDQVMQIAQILAGYSLGKADLLRRAMGKKKPEEMAKQRDDFINGAHQTQGLAIEKAAHIFDLIEKFAGYGFNKAHSAGYAMIVYQTAWLKTHYASAFMASVLSSDMDHTDKVVNFLNECRRLKLKVLPPNVNQSAHRFTCLDKKTLIYGLGAIKGVGQAVVDAMVAKRKDEPYRDLFDMCCRLGHRLLNRRAMEALIRSGALDELSPERANLLASVDKALKAAQQSASYQDQYDMFEAASDDDKTNMLEYVKVPALSPIEHLRGEKASLGFYLTGHPLDVYRDELTQFTRALDKDLRQLEGQTIRIAGLVANVRRLLTKRGKPMAVVNLEDGVARIDVVVFTEAYEQYRELLRDDEIIIVDGVAGIDDFTGRVRLTAQRLWTLDEAREKLSQRLCITVDQQKIKASGIAPLRAILSSYQGGACPLFIAYHNSKASVTLRCAKPWLIKPQASLLTELRTFLGKECVELVY